MTLIVLPPRGIRTISWTLPDPATFVVRNQWTAQQTIGDLGTIRAGTKAKIEIVPMTIADLNAWRAFFAQCRGVTGTFLVNATETDQTPALDMQVDGAGQSGTALNLRGIYASTGILLAGSLLEVFSTDADHALFTLTADLVTNSATKATAALFPALRTTYPDAATAVVRRPRCLMRLVQPAPGWSVVPGRIYTPFAFDCEEAT